MTYLQKTQIRFAKLYIRIEAAETQEELLRLKKIVAWLRHKDLLKFSALTIGYYEILHSNIYRKILTIGLWQKAKSVKL